MYGTTKQATGVAFATPPHYNASKEKEGAWLDRGGPKLVIFLLSPVHATAVVTRHWQDIRQPQTMNVNANFELVWVLGCGGSSPPLAARLLGVGGAATVDLAVDFVGAGESALPLLHRGGGDGDGLGPLKGGEPVSCSKK